MANTLDAVYGIIDAQGNIITPSNPTFSVAVGPQPGSYVITFAKGTFSAPPVFVASGASLGESAHFAQHVVVYARSAASVSVQSYRGNQNIADGFAFVAIDAGVGYVDSSLFAVQAGLVSSYDNNGVQAGAYSGFGYQAAVGSPAGAVDVTFDVAFGETPAVIVMQFHNPVSNTPPRSWLLDTIVDGSTVVDGRDNAVLTAVSKSSFTVVTSSAVPSYDATPRNFAFIAIGPQPAAGDKPTAQALSASFVEVDPTSGAVTNTTGNGFDVQLQAATDAGGGSLLGLYTASYQGSFMPVAPAVSNATPFDSTYGQTYLGAMIGIAVDGNGVSVLSSNASGTPTPRDFGLVSATADTVIPSQKKKEKGT